MTIYIVLFLVATGVVVVGFYLLMAEGGWTAGKERKRSDALRGEAERMGLAFHDMDGLPESEGYLRFPLFSDGNPVKAVRNVMGGKIKDAQVRVFEFKYFKEYGVGHAKTIHHYEQTVAAFPARTKDLPDFELRPEGISEKVGSSFGGQDIDFASHSGFSGKYLLRGKDENGVRTLFGKNVLDFFQEHPGWCVQGGKDWIVLYRHDQRVEAEELAGFLDEAAAAFRSFG